MPDPRIEPLNDSPDEPRYCPPHVLYEDEDGEWRCAMCGVSDDA